MNWEALWRTLCPSKQGFKELGIILLVVAILVGLLAVSAGVVTLLYAGAAFLFGPKVPAIVLMVGTAAFFAWIAIGEPLVGRYHRMKRLVEAVGSSK